MVIVTMARNRYTLILGFACFIALGMMNGVLGVAWPSIRQTFGLSLDALVALLITSTIGFAVGSVFASKLMARLGAGWALLVANLLGAAGLVGYVLAPGWWVLVAFGLLTGWANGTIDTALNIYVAATRTVRTMNWMHACFGVGATIGPLLMTFIVGAGLSWRWGYVVGVVIHLALGVLYLTVVRSMTFRGLSHTTGGDLSARPASMSATLRLPMVWLGLLLFLITLGRRAERAAYTRIAGQPGAVSAVIENSLRGGWTGDAMPVGINPKTQDAVYRVIGKGRLLVAELEAPR